MTEPTPERDPRKIDPAWLRGMTGPRMSRRDLMRYAGIGAGALSLSSILAACGVSGEQATGSATPGGVGSPEWWADQTAGDNVNFTNWPQYIDVDSSKSGAARRPTLYAFSQDSGIDVTYRADINDNAEFYAAIRPALESGQDTGHDIIVITNGQQLTEMIQRGYAIALDHSLTPNFNENAGPSIKDPAYDPGNKYTMAWQSGMTGIAWNSKYVKEPPTSFEDLMKEEYAGHIGMMANDDAPTLAMIALGIDPVTSTPEDWQAAADLLIEQRDSGVLRKYYTQTYLTDLENEDLWITMAWSGDVINDKLYYPEFASLDFVVPDEGGIIWTDNMMIPAGAANPAGAVQVMDWYYQPDIAAALTEWNAYVSPVPSGGEIVQQNAADASGGQAEVLNTIASSPYVFPDDELAARLYSYRVLDGEEIQQWNDLFQPIYLS
jgi:spermidine/putrescine transport system substrate-binding protein